MQTCMYTNGMIIPVPCCWVSRSGYTVIHVKVIHQGQHYCRSHGAGTGVDLEGCMCVCRGGGGAAHCMELVRGGSRVGYLGKPNTQYHEYEI